MKMQHTKIIRLKLLALPLLALLLLLSPCSVKGALQTAFDVEISKSLHKNKTSAPQVNRCSVWDNQSQIETKKTGKKTLKKDIIPAFTSRLLKTNSKPFPSFWLESPFNLHEKLPFYILYKRLKIYDLNALPFV